MKNSPILIRRVCIKKKKKRKEKEKFSRYSSSREWKFRSENDFCTILYDWFPRSNISIFLRKLVNEFRNRRIVYNCIHIIFLAGESVKRKLISRTIYNNKYEKSIKIFHEEKKKKTNISSKYWPIIKLIRLILIQLKINIQGNNSD